jgi:hypothetical protein
VYSVILPLAATLDPDTLLQRPLENRDAIGLLPVGNGGRFAIADELLLARASRPFAETARCRVSGVV